MQNILSPSEIVKLYKLSADKNLGQNFILDQNYTDKIVKSGGDYSNKEIIEIGPGPGCLTRSILSVKPKKLISVELDKRFIPHLENLDTHFEDTDFKVINSDALEINENDYFNGEFHIIANLPYNIATVLIIKWLQNFNIMSMLLMVQKEVADKIVSKDLSRLSSIIQIFCEAKIVFNVSNSVFCPRPKVTSSIIKLTRRDKPLINVNFSLIEKALFGIFHSKRKNIRNNLLNLFNENNVDEILNKLSISKNIRAEDLELNIICDIINEFAKNR